MSAPFAEFADPYPYWPNCVTPDCGNKQCDWSGTEFCFPCAERRVGHEEMVRRFNATHEITWEEATKLSELDDDELLEGM